MEKKKHNAESKQKANTWFNTYIRTNFVISDYESKGWPENVVVKDCQNVPKITDLFTLW